MLKTFQISLGHITSFPGKFFWVFHPYSLDGIHPKEGLAFFQSIAYTLLNRQQKQSPTLSPTLGKFLI